MAKRFDWTDGGSDSSDDTDDGTTTIGAGSGFEGAEDFFLDDGQHDPDDPQVIGDTDAPIIIKEISRPDATTVRARARNAGGGHGEETFPVIADGKRVSRIRFNLGPLQQQSKTAPIPADARNIRVGSVWIRNSGGGVLDRRRSTSTTSSSSDDVEASITPDRFDSLLGQFSSDDQQSDSGPMQFVRAGGSGQSTLPVVALLGAALAARRFM